MRTGRSARKSATPAVRAPTWQRKSETTTRPIPPAEQFFGLDAYTAALTYILAFGATKAITNFFAGTLSDHYGRKLVLIGGWLIALPVPAMLAWGPSWGWIIAANILLGASQGLTWSTTAIMKIDLAGPGRRGLATGLNEAAGYVAVAVTALATGAIAAYAALGLGLSTLVVRETRDHARAEAARHPVQDVAERELTTAQIARRTSFTDNALSAASQAGLVNLNDALAWGIFPLLLAAHGLSIAQIDILAALYPAVWGAGQLLTG
ncbi:MFS transporter [Streptomyces sp. SAS_276]|uniref:MFS transporter n=1 Tax=Streptomyces sp. SAS_276 TaxID=3412745 RepID=UPI00403C4A43